MRRVILSVAAGLALAACATTNTPYPRSSSVTSPSQAPRGPSIYASAPRAPLHSELFACNSWGSNLGLIGQRGEAVNYTPYIDTPAGSLLRLPVEAACLSSGFGWRGSASGGGRQHSGVDLANPNGGFVYAAADGRVVTAEWYGGYGNLLEIDHGRGVRTRYAHLAEIDPDLRPGMRVAAGQAVARMGMTGNATGVHLHYELVVDGIVVDPLHYGLPPQYETTPVTQMFEDEEEPAPEEEATFEEEYEEEIEAN